MSLSALMFAFALALYISVANSPIVTAFNNTGSSSAHKTRTFVEAGNFE